MTRTSKTDPELAALATLIPQLDLDHPSVARKMELSVASEMPTTSRDRDYERVSLTRDDRTELPIAVHRPTRAPGSGLLPALVFLHGGSFITGGIHSELERCATYADTAECIVISVDYRLAPEHPYPAAFADSLDVLDWLGLNAASLGVDTNRVAIGGLSAGGALAAAAALRIRQPEAVAGTGTPTPGPGARSLNVVLLMLLFPVLDASTSTSSATDFTSTPILNAGMLPKMWHHYLGSAEPDQWSSPAMAHDLSVLPPTYITTAQFDPLRDEGFRFASRLLAHEVSVEMHHYPRSYHSFDSFHTTRLGSAARAHQADALRSAFR